MKERSSRQRGRDREGGRGKERKRIGGCAFLLLFASIHARVQRLEKANKNERHGDKRREETRWSQGEEREKQRSRENEAEREKAQTKEKYRERENAHNKDREGERDGKV